jgi:hypothetical protein
LNGALDQGAAGRTQAIGLLNLHNQKYRRLTSKTDTELARYLATNQGTNAQAFIQKRWKEGSIVITTKLEEFYCAPLP